jgi:hypothetical protein
MQTLMESRRKTKPLRLRALLLWVLPVLAWGWLAVAGRV